MPASTIERPTHPAIEPRELGPHEALDGDILYFIGIYPPMHTGSTVVRAERPDGSNWLATEDEIPLKLKVALESGRWTSIVLDPAANLREVSEINAPRIRLDHSTSAEEVFEDLIKPLLVSAAQTGQPSMRLRMVMQEGSAGPPPAALIASLRSLLAKKRLALDVGSLLTEPPTAGSEDSRITYVPWTISW